MSKLRWWEDPDNTKSIGNPPSYRHCLVCNGNHPWMVGNPHRRVCPKCSGEIWAVSDVDGVFRCVSCETPHPEARELI